MEKKTSLFFNPSPPDTTAHSLPLTAARLGVPAGRWRPPQLPSAPRGSRVPLPLALLPARPPLSAPCPAPPLTAALSEAGRPAAVAVAVVIALVLPVVAVAVPRQGAGPAAPPRLHRPFPAQRLRRPGHGCAWAVRPRGKCN